MPAPPSPPAGSPEFDALAERMLRDYDRHTPGTVFGEGLRLSLDDAWRLQAAVAQKREQRGEQVAGYKIGCVSPINQKRNGISHPVWGRLWSSEQHPDGVKLSRADFANVAIEGEFAITLGRDVAAGEASPASLMDAVELVLPVIELHNLLFRGSEPKGCELIANNAIHAGVVRGSGRTKPTGPVASDLSVAFDGKIVDQWAEVHWPDDVLKAVSWLTERLQQSGLGLRRGQTVLTGALGPPLPVAGVSHVEVVSSRFGSVSAWFS